jgi:thiol:disulfide interchange protein DsbA
MPLIRLLSALMLCFVTGSAWSAEFVEGTHYEVLPVSVETRDSSKVEVVEVFSYACIHCFNFDPLIESWRAKQTDEVTFHRMPAIFSDDWAMLAQAFYTAETLGVGAAVHVPLFEGIHVKNQDLRQATLLRELFSEQADVSAEEFDTVYDSFSVRSRVQQAKATGRAYRVTGVPSIIVNGKYRVDGRLAGSNTKMLEVADYLIGLERQD